MQAHFVICIIPNRWEPLEPYQKQPDTFLKPDSTCQEGPVRANYN